MTLIALVLVGSLAQAGLTDGKVELRRGEIYSLKKTDGPPLYVQETRIVTDEKGRRHWTATIKDAKGELIMTEKAIIDGKNIVEQEMEQLQIGEAWKLERPTPKEAHFHTYKIVNGKRQEQPEIKKVKIDGDLLTGPVTELYLQEHLTKLEAGQSVDVEFGVFEVARPVGFRFKKVKKDENLIELKMKPSNFFISMLVAPITLFYDKAEKRMIRYRGRTPLKEKINGEWKPFDAEIRYSVVPQT